MQSYKYLAQAHDPDVTYFLPAVKPGMDHHADKPLIPARLSDNPTPGEMETAVPIKAFETFPVELGSDLHHLVAKSPYRTRFHRVA